MDKIDCLDDLYLPRILAEVILDCLGRGRKCETMQDTFVNEEIPKEPM